MNLYTSHVSILLYHLFGFLLLFSFTQDVQAHCVYNNLSVAIQATASNGNFNEYIGAGNSSCCSWTNSACNPNGNANSTLSISIEIASEFFLTVIEVPANGDIYVEYAQEVVGGSQQIVCKAYNSNNTLVAQVPFLSSPGQSRNVKFLATSDPQFDVNNQSEEDQSIAVLDAMKQKLNSDSEYRGMLISGDLSENTTQQDFDLYKSQLVGYEHITYDGFGNHDMYNHSSSAQSSCQNGSGSCVTPKTIIEDLRQRKRSSLIEYTDIPAQLYTYQNAFDTSLGWEDVDPPHYSWDWGDVHFLQLNLYPGTGIGKQEFKNNTPHYFTPMKSLEYAINDLENNVGNSCRPVILVFHFTFNSTRWTSAEKRLIWNALANYNIALIITGHKSNVPDWVREWNRPSGTNLGPNSITEMVAGTAHLDGRYNDLQIQGNNLMINRWEVDEDDGDIELIGQYNKTISTGIDNDGDGFCISDDCNDNDPSVPATPGSSCNDGNSNTNNDLIQSDGCTCMGTPINGGNCTAAFSGSNNAIILSGLTAPNQSAKIFDVNFNTIFQCFNNCNTTENISVPSGTYYVNIHQWTASWQTICNPQDYVTVGGNSGCTPGQSCDDNNECTSNDNYDNNCNCVGTAIPDNDGDGFCSTLDCNDFDASIPATPGTACNDNNPNTNNDLIQSDGCSCVGTPITGGGCTAVFSGSNNALTISGLTAPNQSAKVFDANFSTVFNCFNNCNTTENISLPNGTYYVNITQWTAGWQVICNIQDYVEVGGSTGCTPGQSCNDNNDCTYDDSYDNNCNCSGILSPDNDNDGFCSLMDCNDFDSAIPTTPGSSCNDGNPNTSNDVILEDGCSCEGTTGGGNACNILVTSQGNAINVNGYSEPNAIIQVFTSNWRKIFSCSGSQCNNPQDISGLSNGSYYVRVNLYNSSWALQCEETKTIVVSSGINLQGDGAEDFLFFNAAKSGRNAALNWTCNTDFKTDHFLIEHATDGIAFEVIQQIETASNTDRTVYYQAEDKTPSIGENYYRLAQVSDNGSIRYSTVEKIIFDLNWDAIILFPNPADYFINVNLKPFVGEALSVDLFNTLGQQMAIFETEELQEALIRFDLANYTPGVYLMAIALENGKRVNRLFTVSR